MVSTVRCEAALLGAVEKRRRNDTTTAVGLLHRQLRLRGVAITAVRVALSKASLTRSKGVESISVYQY